MADDTRDSATATIATPKKKLPKGIVLGPDGKPCRTCNTLSDFTSQRRTLSSAAFAAHTPTTSTTALPDGSNCPPDIEQLGRSSWTLLHSLAGAYPIAPTTAQQSNIKTFMSLFATLYPCWTCAEDFQRYMQREGVRAGSRDEFGRWLCEAHNDVNRKLGKSEFDCRRWEERWRVGWRDGSCD